MIHDYIPIDVDSIPYTQPVTLDNKTYIFGFQYNKFSQQFSIDIYDEGLVPIRLNVPIILNQPLFKGDLDTRLPMVDIIPMDESGNETEVNSSNLGVTVQLCIDDIDTGDTDG